MTRHENQTHWQFVMTQFAETFGAELLNNFLDTPKRDQFSFVQAYFQEQPLAACVMYAIHESIINANDDHGHAPWSKGWDDCFGATFSMYLDDWTMIEYSGLWKLDHEIWHQIGLLIHAYDRGLPVTETTLAKITFDFWETQILLALEDFQKNPATQWAMLFEPMPETKAKKAFYTFTWRKEDGGDFYTQPFEANSLHRALERWQDFWGLDESTCFVFEVKKEVL